MLSTVAAGKAAPENMSRTPAARNSPRRPIRSSPSTTAMRGERPCSAATRASSAAQPCGFTPPAFTTTRTPWRAISARQGPMCTGMKSGA